MCVRLSCPLQPDGGFADLCLLAWVMGQGCTAVVDQWCLSGAATCTNGENKPFAKAGY